MERPSHCKVTLPNALRFDYEYCMLGSLTKGLPVPIQIIHWVIIVNLLIQCLYGSYMVFFVVTGGHTGPLGDAANKIPFELMMTRRLYASETWIAISGLSLYLGMTEILPRILRK